MPGIAKKLLKFLFWLAVIAAGIAAIFYIDKITLDTGANWFRECHSLFGRNLFADGIACVGPLGFTSLGLILALAILYIAARRGRVVSRFLCVTLCLLAILALLSWLFDWIIRQKSIFQTWVQPMAIALTALLGCASVFFALSASIASINNMDADRRRLYISNTAKRIVGIVRVVIMIARFAITIAANVLSYYAVAAVFQGDRRGWFIIVPVIILSGVGIWYSIKSEKGKKGNGET